MVNSVFHVKGYLDILAVTFYFENCSFDIGKPHVSVETKLL